MIKKCFNRMLMTFLALAFVASPALAKDWTILGIKKVDFKGEIDEIDVGHSNKIFKRIKLRVDDAGVYFHKVVVVFGNGERFEVPMRSNIEAGGQTRLIDLPGSYRIIRKVVLVHKTHKGSNKRATVTVLGYRS